MFLWRSTGREGVRIWNISLRGWESLVIFSACEWVTQGWPPLALSDKFGTRESEGRKLHLDKCRYDCLYVSCRYVHSPSPSACTAHAHASLCAARFPPALKIPTAPRLIQSPVTIPGCLLPRSQSPKGGSVQRLLEVICTCRIDKAPRSRPPRSSSPHPRLRGPAGTVDMSGLTDCVSTEEVEGGVTRATKFLDFNIRALVWTYRLQPTRLATLNRR